MMIHFETKLDLGGLVYWLNSVYVHPDHRNKGVFRALYNHVLEKARADPWVKAIRLYVETTNHSAMQVYRKMGMENIEDDIDFHEIDHLALPKAVKSD